MKRFFFRGKRKTNKQRLIADYVRRITLGITPVCGINSLLDLLLARKQSKLLKGDKRSCPIPAHFRSHAITLVN